MAVVFGKYMDRSIGDFVRSCESHIAVEQRTACPNTALIRLLGDAILLAREAVDTNIGFIDIPGEIVEEA